MYKWTYFQPNGIDERFETGAFAKLVGKTFPLSFKGIVFGHVKIISAEVTEQGTHITCESDIPWNFKWPSEE